MITLLERPAYSRRRRQKLEKLLVQTRENPPREIAATIRDTLGVELGTRYAGVPIAHPFGKASGQLSFRPAQVESDIAAGIGFIVLKTVIGEKKDGERSMAEWAVEESKMNVEMRPVPGGRVGWSVRWRGRGWAGNLAQYLDFFRESLDLAEKAGIPVVPSVKCHLPSAPGRSFEREEYDHTIGSLLNVWNNTGRHGGMPVEKDLSPTLAGDRRAGKKETILHWLRGVTGAMVLTGTGTRHPPKIGIKVMNAVFDEPFQVEMLETLCAADPRPDFLVVFNRLYSPAEQAAYGGWELSDRNLRVLDLARERGLELPPLSATGNICSGKVMLEYALRGCENGQVHTFFQVPLHEYTARGGSRTARALHTLLLHPMHGLVPWLWHLNEKGRLEEREGLIHFRDIVAMNDVA